MQNTQLPIFGTIVKGSPNPQNTINIYISQLKDEDDLLHRVANDIHSKLDCIIYYNDDISNIMNRADFVAYMQRMQLIVIIVTDKYLDEDGLFQTEFSYITDSGVRFLPIVFDPKVIPLFERKCETLGEMHRQIQVLDAFFDPSKRPYQRRLHDYLESNLLKTADITRIKENFSRFFFLSYRKIDWRYIEILQRAIHSSDRLWDVGLWYDEYLIPGEKWNVTLKQKIEECNAFIMLMTKHISDEDNYVLTKEYPDARTLNKIIVPIALDTTDISKIETDKFLGLPEVIYVGDCLAIEKAVEGIFANAISNEEIDTEHLYLVGLAYYWGIYAETDKGRGIRLIREAAAASNIEAMAWLKRFYYSHNDREEGVQWHKRLVETLEQQLDEYGSQYLAESMELLDVLMDIGLYEDARKICKKHLSLGGSYGNYMSTLTLIYYYLSAIEYNDQHLKQGGLWEEKYLNDLKINSEIFSEDAALVNYTQDYIRMAKLRRMAGDNYGYKEWLDKAEIASHRFIDGFLRSGYQVISITQGVLNHGQKKDYTTETLKKAWKRQYEVYNLLYEYMITEGHLEEADEYATKMKNLVAQLYSNTSTSDNRKIMTSSIGNVYYDWQNGDSKTTKTKKTNMRVSIPILMDNLSTQEKKLAEKEGNIIDYEDSFCAVVCEIKNQYRAVLDEQKRDKISAEFHRKALDTFVSKVENHIFNVHSDKCYREMDDLYKTIIDTLRGERRLKNIIAIRQYEDKKKKISKEGETDFSNVIVSNNNGEKSIENEKSAWGPTSRDTFKWGNPSDYVVFNSMTDNPKIGDERNFVRIRRYSMDTKFSNKVELEVGAEYEVGVWFDNNAKPELNIKENGGAGIAENVRLRIECPEKVTGTHSAVIKGIISSTNSKLKEIWDTAYAYAGSSVLLRYVPNSAIIHSLGTINGEILSSEAMFGKDGVKLGYWKDAWGVVPGGSEYAGYITFRFKVDQPGFKISSLVSIKDKTNYQRSIVAKPGDVLEFQLSYENTGTINQMQIKACDYLPDGLVYIKGSTSLEFNFRYGEYKASDNLFNGGMNLGDYKPGDWVRVRYQVKVENNKKYFPEGDTVIYNDACIATANGTRRNKVEIIVRR